VLLHYLIRHNEHIPRLMVLFQVSQGWPAGHWLASFTCFGNFTHK